MVPEYRVSRAARARGQAWLLWDGERAGPMPGSVLLASRSERAS